MQKLIFLKGGGLIDNSKMKNLGEERVSLALNRVWRGTKKKSVKENNLRMIKFVLLGIPWLIYLKIIYVEIIEILTKNCTKIN